MDLYEQNYILLRRLAPSLSELPDYVISTLDGHISLHMWVEAREKFTTTVRLSYEFDQKGHRTQYEPNLTVRIYHDARVAETMSAIVNGKPRKMRNASTMEWRWSLNRFLYRWLRYSLHQGHKFEITTKTTIPHQAD
jgi:hypothetical protein